MATDPHVLYATTSRETLLYDTTARKTVRLCNIDVAEEAFSPIATCKPFAPKTGPILLRLSIYDSVFCAPRFQTLMLYSVYKPAIDTQITHTNKLPQHPSKRTVLFMISYFNFPCGIPITVISFFLSDFFSGPLHFLICNFLTSFSTIASISLC